MKRATGFEPVTFCLGSKCDTTTLRPRCTELYTRFEERRIPRCANVCASAVDQPHQHPKQSIGWCEFEEVVQQAMCEEGEESSVTACMQPCRPVRWRWRISYGANLRAPPDRSERMSRQHKHEHHQRRCADNARIHQCLDVPVVGVNIWIEKLEVKHRAIKMAKVIWPDAEEGVL